MLRICVIALAMLTIISSHALPPVSNDVGALIKTLEEHPVKGKAGSPLILNRSFDTTDREQSDRLAKALGFVDNDGNTAPLTLEVPFQEESWLQKIKELQDAGKLKTISTIDAGSPDQIVQQFMQKAQNKWKENHTAFQDYLKTRRADAKALGVASLDHAKLVFDKSDSPLGYFSKRFIIEKCMEELRQCNLDLVKLNASLKWGGPYAGNFEMNSDALVLEAWRTKAIVPWVADRSWFNGEFSPQVLGYYLSLARAAESNSPVFCDLHTGNGQYATGLRRSFYLGLAQGARRIRFVGAVPTGYGKNQEHLDLDQIDIWKTIRELTHEAGPLSPLLANTSTRHPDVAIVVSLTQELWDPSPWVHEERKAIFHAARMSGHNVAILTEEDIQEGKLQKIASIYLVGANIQRETAKVLKNWVANGGSIACVGGPHRDEYNLPCEDMLELQGITAASWESFAKAGPSKITLAQHKAPEMIYWNYQGLKREIPVVYGKQKITPDPKVSEKFHVFGKFKDESPAIVKYEYVPEKLGHCWVVCAPTGSGWLKTSLLGKKWEVGNKPTSYNHQLHFKFLDGDIGDIVMCASGDARFDVITDNLAIENIVLEGPKTFLVFSINWSTKPEKAWLTAQYIPKGMDGVRSLSDGPLNVQRIGITLTFPKNLEFKVTEVFVIE